MLGACREEERMSPLCVVGRSASCRSSAGDCTSSCHLPSASHLLPVPFLLPQLGASLRTSLPSSHHPTTLLSARHRAVGDHHIGGTSCYMGPGNAGAPAARGEAGSDGTEGYFRAVEASQLRPGSPCISMSPLLLLFVCS